jgi:hypothetical protein
VRVLTASEGFAQYLLHFLDLRQGSRVGCVDRGRQIQFADAKGGHRVPIECSVRKPRWDEERSKSVRWIPVPSGPGKIRR